MAGYPANYAWNESAKACQPYRSVIPNTYDGGLTGYLWFAILSLTLALFCGVILKRH